MLSTIGSVLGIAGFFLSCVNFTYFFMIRRKKLTINFGIYGITRHFNNKMLLKIHFKIDNLSQLPISVTRIQAIIGVKSYDNELIPHIVEQLSNRRNNEIYDQTLIKSQVLPINLNSLSSHSGYFAFVIPQGILPNDKKALTFRICTNRGKAIQKTFLLHEDNLCR